LTLSIVQFLGSQTGSLVSQLSDNPQKVNGLAGITLGVIIQGVATLIAGSVLGLVFIWKVALVGIGKLLLIFYIWISFYKHLKIACAPLLISTGYIRLVSPLSCILDATYLPAYIASGRAQGSDQQKGP